MRHQTDVPGDSIADLDAALAALRSAGAPDDAELRLRCRPSWNPDGGTAKTLTARWDGPRTT